MNSTVLAFSGGIGSGKSAVSDAVAQALGCPRVSFGRHMRRVAEERGLGTDRDALQAVGEQLVLSDAQGLCREVLAGSGWMPGGALVIDGVRHLAIAEALARMARPSGFRLVHLTAGQSTRTARLRARGEEATRLEDYEKHSTELDVLRDLPARADLVVNGARPLEVVIEEVVAWAEALP